MKRKKPKKRSSNHVQAKPYWRMTTSELAKATKEFDREFVADTFGTPTPAAKAQLQRAQRGRPRIGKGARRVLITVERNLLAQADAYAKQHRLNGSQLVAKGLRSVIEPKAA